MSDLTHHDMLLSGIPSSIPTNVAPSKSWPFNVGSSAPANGAQSQVHAGSAVASTIPLTINSGSMAYGGGFAAYSVGTIQQAQPTFRWSSTGDSLTLTFTEVEGSDTNRATLELDHPPTPLELFKIQQLISALQAGACVRPLSYIRKNNLERHFRFTSA